MKAADIDWSMLRGALIGLGIAVLVSAVLLGVSYHFWEASDQKLRRANSTLRVAEDEYRKLDELEQMIATFYPRFQDLERDGIIGEERRLEWTETLERADEELKLPDVKYTINTQDRHKTEFSLPEGTYKLFASEMNLNLVLLHEDDLFRLLSLLEEDADGLYTVESCTLTRTRDQPGRPDLPHINTACKLFWYTIRNPEQPGAAS